MLDSNLPAMHREAKVAADNKVVTMDTHFERLFDHYEKLVTGHKTVAA